MKYVFVGPGYMTIPPNGWGACEILIDDYRKILEELGHEVHIVNTPIPQHIVSITNALDPDIVHIQYDDYAFLADHFTCKNVVLTSHFAYLEQPHRWHKEYTDIFWAAVNSKKLKIFCLSEGIMDIYHKGGIPKEKLFLNPNGVRTDLFRFNPECERPNDSICLGKIDPRKRQALLQGIPDLYFAGRIEDENFKGRRLSTYLGEWSKEKLYKDLTNFANLVLLSDGEAHPLVCMEAMAAGLGIVVSEFATANLDLDLPFISVVSEKELNNREAVVNIIKENRKRSLSHRNEIREYALTKDWKKTIEEFYIKNSNIIMEHIRIL